MKKVNKSVGRRAEQKFVQNFGSAEHARASCSFTSFTPCSRPADFARRVPTGAFVILMGLQ